MARRLAPAPPPGRSRRERLSYYLSPRLTTSEPPDTAAALFYADGRLRQSVTALPQATPNDTPYFFSPAPPQRGKHRLRLKALSQGARDAFLLIASCLNFIKNKKRDEGYNQSPVPLKFIHQRFAALFNFALGPRSARVPLKPFCGIILLNLRCGAGIEAGAAS